MSSKTSAPVWFYIVAAIALLWNMMGVIAFAFDPAFSQNAMNALPADQQQMYAARPLYALIAFGGAVILGALGCVLLLIRKAFAVLAFIVSLICVIVQQVYFFFLSNTFEILGNGAMVMPIMIVVIAIFLVWFAHMSKGKGWIK